MKLLHTADLHIGKVISDFSMLEDQKFILEQIKGIAYENQVDGILLAGDIYDRAIPSAEAVVVFSDFLTELSEKGIAVYMVSGNHDSPERISFGEALLRQQKIAIGGLFKGELPVFSKEDEYGIVEIVLFPFIKPSWADERTMGAAVEKILKSYWQRENTQTHPKKRRVLVTHYFVTDGGKEPELSDSETTIHVGGLDNVEASLFDGFDYVALGHIHKPQQISKRPVYYAGSPLKYSFSEVNQEKSVQILSLNRDGLESVQQYPLRPLHEMRKVEGTLQEIMENALMETEGKKDYIQAVLTNTEELIDPIGTLRSVYPGIMQIIRKEKKEGPERETKRAMAKKRNPTQLFEEFYMLVRGEELTEEKRKLIEETAERAKENL